MQKVLQVTKHNKTKQKEEEKKITTSTKLPPSLS